jgi:hypothetical protein
VANSGFSPSDYRSVTVVELLLFVAIFCFLIKMQPLAKHRNLPDCQHILPAFAKERRELYFFPEKEPKNFWRKLRFPYFTENKK